MEYFNLPNTELKASKIALGCMRIASKSEEEVEALVLTALQSGINFFDHADIYGGGKSEALFGSLLKKSPNLRQEMIIQTKCGIVPGKRFDFSKEYIIKSVEGSLQRLQTEYIDILLLHRPVALVEPKEVAEAFDTLYLQGKVKYFGVSNHTPYQIELLKKYCKQPIVINQVQFGPAHASMIDSGIFFNMKAKTGINRDGGTIDYCRLHDITLQAWSTIRADLASDTFIDNPAYPKINAVLETLSTKYKVSKVAIVTAWILRHPANIQPIVGTTSPSNLLDTIDALKVKLSRDEWYTIYTAEDKPLP